MGEILKTENLKNQKSDRGLINPFLITITVVLMIAAYSQSPLYTSNQNQTFVHGMAGAGIGSLDQDWLASTAEPTPVFTFILKWTFLFLKSELWFYFYYAVLIGVYFLALLGILDEVYGIRESKIKFLMTALLLIFFHSAGLRFLLTNYAGAEWGFLLDGGFAGQRLLGIVFQPSAFGVVLVLSLYLFLIGKPYLAALAAAVTANIHPTYLLSAALLTGGYMCVTFLEDKKLDKPIRTGLIALIAISPIMVYIFTNFWGGDESVEAYRILTDIRLPHHAVIREWFNLTSIIKIVIIAVGLASVKKQQRLFIPLAIVFFLSTALTVIQYVLDSDFLALIFPWRPSTLLVPVCSAIIYGYFASRLSEFIRNPNIKKTAVVVSSLVSILLAAVGIIRMILLFEKKTITLEANLFAWVDQTSTDSDKYLIPVGLETFRTSTLRPAYVDFFAIPYSDADIITWYHRVLAANKFYDGDCDELMYLKNDDDITYVITEKEKSQPDCVSYDLVYEGEYYLAYRINRLIYQ